MEFKDANRLIDYLFEKKDKNFQVNLKGYARACPFCGSDEHIVIDSKKYHEEKFMERRLESDCSKAWSLICITCDNCRTDKYFHESTYDSDYYKKTVDAVEKWNTRYE